MNDHTELCERVARKLGWRFKMSGASGGAYVGVGYFLEGKPAPWPRPDWTFAGAVLEELARRAIAIVILHDGSGSWEVGIGARADVVDNPAPLAILQAADAALPEPT